MPFLRVCLPLCAGICSGLLFTPDKTFLLISAAVILPAFIFSLRFNGSEINMIFGFVLTAALYLSGLLLYTGWKNNLSTLEPHQALYACTVSDFPAEKSNSNLLRVKLECLIHGNEPKAVNGSVLLYCRKDMVVSQMMPGDRLLIRFSPVEISDRGNPDEFKYRFFMENHGFRYYALVNRSSIAGHIIPRRRKLIYRALILREKIIGMYEERGITGERLALVAAITLGQKNMLEADQKISFMKAGVMHIMAVSGLHTGILSLFVFNILFFLRGRLRFLRILITILLLWSFAFITGLAPSVLRATIMFSFLHAGNLMKRPANGINSVLASAFILLIIRPPVLFEAGFLLSYSAVIYIIAFYGDLYRKVVFNNFLADKIWQSAAVTIIAQAGTLPLTITLFNRFPVYFILTNILIVPVSALLVITGCLAVLTFPLGIVSACFAFLLNNIAGLIGYLTEKAASLPFSSIGNIGMTTTECLLSSIAIFLFTIFLLKPKSILLRTPLTVLLIFTLYGTVSDLYERSASELIVYNTPGSSAIGIRTGKMLYLFTDADRDLPEVRRHCSVKRLTLVNTGYSSAPCRIRAGNKSILITGSLNSS